MRVNYNAAASFANNSNRVIFGSLKQTLERLSTGVRINRASDDAAGLSISEGFRAQIRGTRQAQRNVQDAVALFNIEEGTLNEVGNLLQRVRELGIQAANGTMTDTERVYLNEETAALLEEIDRLASVKPYNGAFALDGSAVAYSRTTSTANEAIADKDSVIVSDGQLVEQFFGELLTVEVLAKAGTQELEDASVRSEHIQELLTGWTDSVLAGNSTVTGTTDGSRNSFLVDFVTEANNSADEVISLRRFHDNTLVTRAIDIIGGSIAGGGNFQLDIQGAVGGAVYEIADENISTDASGVSGVIGDTALHSINQVQIQKFAEQFLADPDGVVNLSRGDLTAIDLVEVRNFTEEQTGDADGSFTLSRTDVNTLQEVLSRNASEQVSVTGTTDIGLSSGDINTLDQVEAKNWSDYASLDADGVLNLSYADIAGLDLAETNMYAEQVSELDNLISLTNVPVDIKRVEWDNAGVYEDLTEFGASVNGDRVYRQVGNDIEIGTNVAGVFTDNLGTYGIWATYTTAGLNTVQEKTAAALGSMAYELTGNQIIFGKKTSGGTLDAVQDQEIAVSYSTTDWKTLSEVDPFDAADVGKTGYTWDGTDLKVGIVRANNTLEAASDYNVWASYSTNAYNAIQEEGSAATGATAYTWDGDRGITIGKKPSSGALEQVPSYDMKASYSLDDWIDINEVNDGAASDGDIVYELTGSDLKVGVKNGASIDSVDDYDVWTQYSISSWVDVASDSASSTPGEMVYNLVPGASTITIGRDDGSSIKGTALNAVVDYRGWEDEYELVYKSYNKYQLSDADAVKVGNTIQFAEDLYTGSSIPGDNNSSTRMEVRVDGGGPESGYTYYDSFGGQDNVIVFDKSPDSGASISVDYATPSGTDVDWTSATTLGETTMADATITLNEAASNDGIFNDFWSGQSADTISITQPNRGRTMSLTINPNWTIQQFIDNFNNQAQLDDVEAEAYWDSTDSEVRIRPGTSGWRERDITGWAGSYFNLSGTTITSGSNVGPGGSGDVVSSQNTFQQTETAAASSSTIRVTREDGSVLLENTSTWNKHDLSSIGLEIDILSTAEVGDTSSFYISTGEIQAGPNTGLNNKVYFTMPDINTDQMGVDNLHLQTRCAAERAISQADDAIDFINSKRTYFGSRINKCESVINTLAAMDENGTFSESLIRDADMAFEATNFAKQQIMSQAVMSVAAQANASSKNILTLLNSL